ncbi:MAG TPA: homoserine dehydrogenase [Acidimicrobiia bacterium]|nr:homoserine dehydrogenase [Acidimicrobiia bacterium]
MRVGIGILGGGVVGGSLAHKLLDEHETIRTKTGLDLQLVRVAVRDLSKARLFPADYATDRPEDVVTDPDVRLVVELMGGLEPARSLVVKALEAGKPVVTANKALVAAEGPALFEKAAAHGVSLLFEAAVGGGIPIIRPLSESLAGERITSVMGIVNGTTNFILTRMSEDGLSYSDVLADAQRLGYAEADPTADVSGADAAAKAAILAGLAFGVWVDLDRVHTEGIADIESIDLVFADRLGYVVKLLGIAEATADGVSVRVHPTLVPSQHPLAAIRGAQNAVFVSGPALGELLFSGPGAGGDPTATAVLGDVVTAARELLADTPVTPRVRIGAGAVADFGLIDTSQYLRLEVDDAPGVLAAVSGAFGEAGVSIRSVWQEGRGEEATLLLITHAAPEAAHAKALGRLSEISSVRQVAAVIRVAGEPG